MQHIEKYKQLPDNIYDTFDELTDKAYELFVAKKYEESFSIYEQCLEMIPEPKSDYGESSNVIEWMVENYLLIGRHAEAIKWVEQLSDYLKNKDITGDGEFLKAKVYFEVKDLGKSLEYFRIADEKTKGRCFEDEDNKYLYFYQNPGQYVDESIPALINPELDDKVYDQIVVLAETGDEYAEKEEHELAISKYQEALNLLPEPKTDWEAATWLYVALGDALFNLEQFDAALGVYEQALMSPDGTVNPYIWFSLGSAFYELNNMGKAKTHFMSAYLLDGDDIFRDANPAYLTLISDEIAKGNH